MNRPHQQFVENLLNGPWIRRGRYGLVGLLIFGVSGDYYAQRHYIAYDPAEAEPWVVDWSVIGRPRPTLSALPNEYSKVYTPFGPRNGETVLARVAPEYPHYIQLLSGRFIERSTCGAELCIPLSTLQKQKLELDAQHASVPALLTKPDPPPTVTSSSTKSATSG